MRLREIVDVADQLVGSGFSSIELRNKAGVFTSVIGVAYPTKVCSTHA